MNGQQKAASFGELFSVCAFFEKSGIFAGTMPFLLE